MDASSSSYVTGAVPFYPLSRGTDKLDLTRFSGYKFRSASAKRACRSVPRARKELKSAQDWRMVVPNTQAGVSQKSRYPD
ncbi:hypothetical protein TNCV_2638111 [Trichonephila clavipes]|nr:hypothetical protein TNCV_2638111 [Trichonephila clavipes]